MARKHPQLIDESAEPMGRRLARLRRERGLTQAEVAERLQVTQANVSDYERGKCRLHADAIIQLIKILNVSAEEFLGLEPTPKSPAVKDRRFLQRLAQVDRLSKRNREALLRTINAFLAQAA